ncbi:hypothetical protein [Nocardioides jiangxiensis]|uniref:Serine/threonine protein kinase n=1 Tax=Nocardioides jiangxiensis TaxID=3064524 RepID=A0ABT9AWQ5_9ACTN|nr:hypothetical protein [Nocardioides sp. WY-20]MDO7866899.1 hypothetical protein [Nocardioides sp. WY-20]
MKAAELRVDVPRREPSDAFVAQMAGLAAAGAPAPVAAPVRRARWRGWTGQAVAVAAVLLLILGAIVLGGRSDRAAPAPATTPTSTGLREHATPTVAPREPGPDDVRHRSNSVTGAYSGTAGAQPTPDTGDPVGTGPALEVSPKREVANDPDPADESPDVDEPEEDQASADVADDPVDDRGGDDAE